ncbi:twisted gastrulation protein homolog 1-A-like [Babylonia areolata]|uniref:twisted gastrulation protein homolog 1-A-like n=1 Tax=Babylonia areolata TaxID=304850 RepID=UPI003FD16A09
MRSYILPLVAAVLTIACLYTVDACNEALCAPLVSKCMLIKCCECDMTNKKNCTCCRDCQVCLAKLYTQCCSCVGLCPAPDPDDGLYRTSSIETLPDPIPDLFAVLTEEEDFHQRWTTHTYAYNLDSLLFKPGTGYTPDLSAAITEEGAGGGGGGPSNNSTGLMGIQNCSTAFFSQCMSIAKCKISCKSMGAAKYRWFHEYGCCQCIGSTCLDYGLNEPHCLHCPPRSNSVEEEEGEYGGKESPEHEDSMLDQAKSHSSSSGISEEEKEDVKLGAHVVPDSV